jgi:ribosomal protein L24
VRVLEGKHKGETGIVISSEAAEKGSAIFANIALSQSKKEIRVLTNNLKLKSEIE